MKGGQLPTNQLHVINWGALDHASRAPQLTTICVCVHACVCVRACVHAYVCLGK